MGRRIQPLSLYLFISDLVLVILSLFISSQLRSMIPIGRGGALDPDQTMVPILVYLLAVVCWGIGLTASGVYDPQLSLRWHHEAVRVIWGGLVATVLMAGALFVLYRELSRLQFVYFFLVSVAMMLLLRGVLRVYYELVGKFRPGSRSRVVVLGSGETGRRVGQVLLDHSRWGFHLVGFLANSSEPETERILDRPLLGNVEDLHEISVRENIDEVWIALPAHEIDRLGDVLDEVETLPLRIKLVPDYFSYAFIQTKPEVLGNLPVIGLRDPLIEGLPRLVKRGFDMFMTSLLLIIALPIMAVIAILIRITSRGPIIFRQERLGENGRVFEMLKFRTMVDGAEDRIDEVIVQDEGGRDIHKRADDPRVTGLGRFLRRYSLDELPQLINILKGEMSLVGPRPEMPQLVNRYQQWQRKRFAVPQGLTGWWQINGRGDRPMHLHTDDDLYYVYNYSLWLDLVILARTPWAVIKGKGAF